MIIFISVVSSCRVVKDLEEGDQLLVKNKVELRNNSNVDEETLYNIIKQKPNTKLFFFFRFNTWVYNRFVEDKLEQKREKKQAKLDRKNERRVSKGKKAINKSNETLRERIKSNLGEKPTLYDPKKTEKSVEQLETYMKKNGYFDVEVNHLLRNRDSKKVTSRYIINPGNATKLNLIKWDVKDTVVASYLPVIKKRIELKPGNRFDVEKLDQARVKVTEVLVNSGF